MEVVLRATALCARDDRICRRIGTLRTRQSEQSSEAVPISRPRSLSRGGSAKIHDDTACASSKVEALHFPARFANAVIVATTVNRHPFRSNASFRVAPGSPCCRREDLPQRARCEHVAADADQMIAVLCALHSRAAMANARTSTIQAAYVSRRISSPTGAP